MSTPTKCLGCGCDLYAGRVASSPHYPDLCEDREFLHRHTEARCLRRQRDALQAVVDKLTRTANDVPVVPGMTLWDIDPEGNPIRHCSPVHPWLVVLGRERGWHGPVDPRRRYSTPEAAAAAAAARGQH